MIEEFVTNDELPTVENCVKSTFHAVASVPRPSGATEAAPGRRVTPKGGTVSLRADAERTGSTVDV